jgi:hypothetical protein
MAVATRIWLRAALAAATSVSLAVFASTAGAQAINYNNHVGTTVTYQQVIEDSSTDSTPLYGSPTVTGNNMSFSPTAFAASSSGGGVDFTDGKLQTTIVANNTGTGAIHFINVTEQGDYTLSGSGTSTTHVTIGAPVDLTVTEVNGVGVTPVPLPPQNLVFSPASAFDLASNPGTLVTWTGGISINVDALLAATPDAPSGRITAVQYVMDNSMFAQSQVGTTAMIEKSNGGFVDVAVIAAPEPSTAVLALIGSLALAWHLRRRAG